MERGKVHGWFRADFLGRRRQQCLIWQHADEPAGRDRAAHHAEVLAPQLQSADDSANTDRAAHIAGDVAPQRQQ